MVCGPDGSAEGGGPADEEVAAVESDEVRRGRSADADGCAGEENLSAWGGFVEFVHAVVSGPAKTVRDERRSVAKVFEGHCERRTVFRKPLRRMAHVGDAE